MLRSDIGPISDIKLIKLISDYVGLYLKISNKNSVHSAPELRPYVKR